MLLSIVAVALGVGYLAGSLSLLQRVGAGLAAQAGAGNEPADLVIEGAIADDGPLQQVRKLVPDAIALQIADIDGVAAVEPRLESSSTLIIGADNSPVVALGLTERPLGANFPESESLNPYRFVGDGRAPKGEDEVVIDAASAAVAKVGVGDEVAIAGKVGLHLYTVTGIVEMAHGEMPAGSSLALFETAVARPLFELGPDDNAIAIEIEAGADLDEVRTAIRQRLIPGAEVSTGDEYAEHRQASLAKSFTMIRALLVGFAGLALVVGSFTVANSMALLFDHRRRGFAMLRLMGASPSQLVSAATAESLIGGLIAGAFGLVLGLGVGAAIEHLIQSMGTPLPVAGSALTWWIPLVALFVGAAVTVATALSPARHASRTPPVHAVTGADDRPNNRSRLATVVRSVVAVVVIGVGAAIAGAVLGGGPIALIAGGAGAAVALVLVVLPRLLSGIVGAATALLLGSSVALRRMSTLRSRQARTRAASTTAALLLASAIVTSLTALSTSFVQSIEEQVSSSITADLVVDSATFTKGGLSADLIPLLREQEGVAAVSGWRAGAAYVDNTLWRAGGLDGASMFRVLDLDVDGTTPPAFAVDDVVISETLADSAGLRVDQTIPVTFQNSVTMPMRIRAVFKSQLRVLLGDVIVDSTVLAANLPQSTDVLAFVKLAPDAPASTRADITTLSKRYGAANVLDPEDLVSTRAELLRGFGRVIQWMLAFSVILAVIGVANTLQLGVNERRRELGLIRAVGATREQVLRIVMAEATALSVVGTLFGIVIGLVAAWATVQGLSDYGLNQFVVPIGTLIGVAFVAVGLGLVGAIVPALRASRIPLLDAIADSGDADHGSSRRRRIDGRKPDAPAIVDAPTPPGAGPAPQAPVPPPVPTPTPAQNPEVRMALRCYSCGNEPGDGETCAQCGAPQTVTPVDLFTLRPDAPVAPTAASGPPPPPPGATFASTVGADIVDAAVVENGIVVDPSTPPPYVATTPDAARPPAASLFDGRPTPSQAADPMRSPFGQHASAAPTPPPVEPEIVEDTEPARPGIFSAGTVDESAPAAPAPPQRSAPSSPPPAYGRGPATNGTATNGTGRNGGTPRSNLPDAHGLGSAVSRLSAASQEAGHIAFSIAGALLAHDERVLGAVSGSSLGMPTVVVVTPIRALVVSDRTYVPEVEIFELGPDLTVHGRHLNDQASLTFTDRDRLVTIDQIADVGIAVEVANIARTRTAAGEF